MKPDINEKLERKAFTYLVKCKDNSLYCGWCYDIQDREDKHNGLKSGGAKYTKARRPVKMVYYEEHSDKISAMKREYRIKKLSRKNKLHLVEEGQKAN